MANNGLYDKVVSGQAWAEFCDALKAAGELVQERSTCDLDRVEGYRFLSRLARGGLYSSIETGNLRFPLITAMPDQVKIGSDNPDSLYLSGNIDGRLNYRISGHRGTVHYLSITAFTGTNWQPDTPYGGRNAANSPIAANGRGGQRSQANAARISATNSLGCSKAAKCPPASGSFQYLMSV